MTALADGELACRPPVQRDEKVPHRRHWDPLAELAEQGWEEAERQRELKGRFADVDFEEEVLPSLDEFTLAELSEKTGLSPSYLSEIRRREKVLSLEYWKSLVQL